MCSGAVKSIARRMTVGLERSRSGYPPHHAIVPSVETQHLHLDDPSPLGWLKEGAQFSRIIYASVALLFILLGNFMTKLRPNYFIGIRTPWTLESKEVWIKTHRVVSRVMVLGGILMLTLCF